jgi:hypothetical protein
MTHAAKYLSDAERLVLLGAIRREKLAPTAQKLGLGREATAALAAGIECRPGSVALARLGLQNLAAPAPARGVSPSPVASADSPRDAA